MSLPLPDIDAKARSMTLQHQIRQAIIKQCGWISFRDYMHRVLYTPELGYYTAPNIKLGAQGDFITAPEISPLFGYTLANSIAPILAATQGSILEFGAGSGQLAIDIMQGLMQHQILPKQYAILEVSAELRYRQQVHIQRYLPHLSHHFCWLDALPPQFSGVMLGNEVLDAMPCHLICRYENQYWERGVALNPQDEFIFEDRPISFLPLQKALASLNLPNDYVTEIQLEAQAFIRSLAATLRQGIILLVDYGFEENEYYHPQRSLGTLMCHYRHHAHSDPFFYPGLQDITTHINFTALNRAAEDANLNLAGYRTQSQYLIQGGLLNQVAPGLGNLSWYQTSQQIQRLTHPAEMGELFKAIAFSKQCDIPIIGLAE